MSFKSNIIHTIYFLCAACIYITLRPPFSSAHIVREQYQ